MMLMMLMIPEVLATPTLTAGGKKKNKKNQAPLESKIAHENSAA
jgi:hypothetical protein